ncbi:hypothetical protein [Streptomyces sp. WAC 01325]|uniref:Mom family adenine methylcarbamoylation protein n=1 Tax=Streptomyces sp. WAC 01325 TaxID=2203202 RepID=UPI0021AF5235|nr:hypothetical protein [Streptomyces sp. WAC 01325]
MPFEDLEEHPTTLPWCQRWRERKHMWRHISEGGFDARRYEVDRLSEADAEAFVLRHHYAASYPAAVQRFGLYDISTGERRLCGVAVFGVPVSKAVLTKPLPELEPYTESLECSRFVLLDECPGNSESFFLARCHTELLASGVRGVVSFADPVPRRTASGILIHRGHCGWIYQSTNGVYAGRATARTIKLLPDGSVFHDRAAQKVRRQEQGHEYAEAQLIALGAPVPRAGFNGAAWLREALVAVGARNVRHRGAHRYVFRLGRSRREREQVKLGLPARQPYPKRPDPEPARSDEPFRRAPGCG